MSDVEIREVCRIEELAQCVRLQRKVFALPEVEISPVRHFVVTKNAGGFTLGAFTEDKLIGFVLSVPAFLGNQKFFYSHMAAVRAEFQSFGIGTKLKWAQREESLKREVEFIKWTFQPVQARNAYFNLEKLGAVVREYHPNFYGMDYSTAHKENGNLGIESDRLFAEWHLQSEKVVRLSKGKTFAETGEVKKTIEIPNDWNELVKTNPREAVIEQARIKNEFQTAFAGNLIGRRFEKSETDPKFLFFGE
jgi:predicted GNAT superfamily acetyltransferase